MPKWPLDFVVVSLLFAPNSIIVLFPRGESGGMNHKRTPLEGGGGLLRNNSNFITRFDWERGWSGNAPNLVVVNLSSENECDTGYDLGGDWVR